MNHPSIINYDIKSHTLATGSRPQRLRFGYLLLAGLTTLMAVALLSGKSEPARAIQTVSLTLDGKESAMQTLALPQTVTRETAIPETVTLPGHAPDVATVSTPPATPAKQASVPARARWQLARCHD